MRKSILARALSFLLSAIFMILILAGCGPSDESSVATAKVLAATKISRTQTVVQRTSTETPTTTPTRTPRPSSTLQPTPLAGGGRILYASNQDGNYEIYIMNAETRDPVRLTQNYVSDREPALSKDGTKIAFISTYGGAGSGIVIMDSNGGNPIHRFTFPKGVGGSPSWGPDNRLVFWAHACLVWCNHTTYDPKFYSVLYFMDSDGGNQRMVELPFREGAPLDPQWSPDGEKVAIADGTLNIAILNPTGGRLDANPDRYVNCRNPAWSPDGSKIAFVSSNEGNDEIYVFDVERDRVLRLTENQAADRKPSWSPDGKWIAFASNRDGNWNIYIIRSDGSDEQRLTESAANELDPAWYP